MYLKDYECLNSRETLRRILSVKFSLETAVGQHCGPGLLVSQMMYSILVAGTSVRVLR